MNHLNGDKLDPRAENLEWCTPSENRLHAFATGLITLTDKFRASVARNAIKAHAACRKLTYQQACEIRRRFANGEKQIVLAREHGITLSTLRSLLLGETYKSEK